MSPSAVGFMIRDVRFTGDKVHMILADGREIFVPLEWYPKLRDASKKERSNWRLIAGGVGVHWKDLDEDLSAEGLLRV